MKNYLNFETDIKDLENELDKLKDPFNQSGLSEVDTKKISKTQDELDKKLKTATLMDIKTTINVSPTGFAKEIKNWNYGVQAVFYMKCCKSIGLNVDRFIFFAVCKETGICTKHTLSELYLKYAEKQMFKAMAELLDAQISGKFSTGWPDENVIHLPSYLEDEIMEEM